ncbi:DUF6367 family protein [Pseudomonas sp. PhalM4]
MKSLSQYLNDALNEKAEAENQAIEEVSVLIPSEALLRCGIALESRWVDDKSGWAYRIDPEDPSIPLQRHVHISKTRSKSAKQLQVSWNVDGSRHDKSSFNVELGRQRYVQVLARRVLKLDSTITLEDINQARVSPEMKPSDTWSVSADGKEAFVRFTFDTPQTQP